MKPFKRLLHNKKAVSGLVLGLIIVLVMIATIIPISLYVVTKIEASMPALEADSAAANASEDLYENIYAAYSISSITPLIAVAGVIIGMIVVGFAIKRGV